ncbi:hypothetical protein [Streptomyces sp. SID1034]|uniref:AbiTii domain-containing protein n=1 Tax=Streptomyces sp. SID1034 TaxID=2690248 RepID=UPI001369F550|nr:hypothetical protein [Streptomyces sp. SID1034]MYV94033.1 hypothetical protein [Streptomyces sp. SID1034]
MNRRDRSLLTEIERDALDENKPLRSVLRKCVVLGGHSSSAELRTWATRELRGYDGVPTEDVPGYRKVPATIQVDAQLGFGSSVRGQRISPQELPDFARDVVTEEVIFRNGISEMEAMAARSAADHAHVRLSLPGGIDLARALDAASGRPYQHISEIYWSVSSAALQGLVDQVRTTIAELVGELRAAMPDDSQTPTPEQMDHAIRVVVHGDRARVNVTAAQSSGSGNSSAGRPEREGEEGPFWTLGRKIGGVVVGLATLIGTVAAVWPLLSK